jgi:PhzF family phenazine biosynthesis protein
MRVPKERGRRKITMGLSIYHVDAFTDKPFTGNPAAVCLLPGPRDASWMQNVAKEMNLSETAFLTEEKEGFKLRWFTPAVEVDLCGHATLASAHILWETGRLTLQEKARFHTRSGLLTAEVQKEEIELNFPAKREEPSPAPPGLLEALGVKARYVGKSLFDFLVEVESEEIVRTARPDFSLLKSVPVRGVIITSHAQTAGFDFISRFFAPQVGVNEDPVTGSAHCTLGPFWSNKLGKKEFLAYQASERGGTVRVRLADDRVFLGGRAVTLLRGELLR